MTSWGSSPRHRGMWKTAPPHGYGLGESCWAGRYVDESQRHLAVNSDVTAGVTRGTPSGIGA